LNCLGLWSLYRVAFIPAAMMADEIAGSRRRKQSRVSEETRLHEARKDSSF